MGWRLEQATTSPWLEAVVLLSPEYLEGLGYDLPLSRLRHQCRVAEPAPGQTSRLERDRDLQVQDLVASGRVRDAQLEMVAKGHCVQMAADVVFTAYKAGLMMSGKPPGTFTL